VNTVHELEIELTDSAGPAASSLSDSTVDEPHTFSSLSAVRGWVSRLQVAALRVQTRQASFGVRPSWDARDRAVRTDWDCVPAAAFNPLTRR
jgi:hypothetical protein